MLHQFVIDERFLWCQVATSRTIPIMHSFPRCIFMFHFDLEKTKSCKYVAT